MKILGTNVYNDLNGEVIGIAVPIEIEKDDRVTPISTYEVLKEWFEEISEDSRRSIIRNGTSGAAVEENVQDLNYSIKIGVWRPYYPEESLAITDVLLALADSVWKKSEVYLWRLKQRKNSQTWRLRPPPRLRKTGIQWKMPFILGDG